MIIVTAAVCSFFASARSLQIGNGVAVIAVTSVAANLSSIVAGLVVFGDQLGNGALLISTTSSLLAPLNTTTCPVGSRMFCPNQRPWPSGPVRCWETVSWPPPVSTVVIDDSAVVT